MICVEPSPPQFSSSSLNIKTNQPITNSENRKKSIMYSSILQSCSIMRIYMKLIFYLSRISWLWCVNFLCLRVRGPTYRRAAFGPRNRAGRRVGRESVCRTWSTPSRRHLCISSRTHESSHSSLPFHLWTARICYATRTALKILFQSQNNSIYARMI